MDLSRAEIEAVGREVGEFALRVRWALALRARRWRSARNCAFALYAAAFAREGSGCCVPLLFGLPESVTVGGVLVRVLATPGTAEAALCGDTTRWAPRSRRPPLC